MSEAWKTYTGVDLSDTAPICAPWEPDRFGRLMPNLSTGLLRLAAELSADTYRLALENWVAAGWQDAAVQMENALSCALDDKGELDKLRLQALRNQVNRRDPFNEAVGSLRQMRATDTGKALVMTHPTGDGRHVVAISFMGTVARFYDWFANFRLASQDGFHQGFLALARQFEANEAAITLPQTAAALGLERLTLGDVLAEAATPNSRFVLFLTGHSQGGAVMQVYAHLKLKEGGVLPQNMVGVGFAAPSVAKVGAVEKPWDYPLYLVMNSDDVVPRFGAVTHLGECLIYPAGQELRQACYNWPRDEKSVAARVALRSFYAGMDSTAGGIISGSGLLQALANAQPGEFFPALSLLSPGMTVLRNALPRNDALIGSILKRAAAAYESVYDQPVDEAAIARAKSLFEQAAQPIGIPAAMAALAQLALNPHSMYPKRDHPDGVYVWITLNGTGTLLPACWTGGESPRLVRAERMAHVHGSRLQPPLFNTRRSMKLPRRDSKRRITAARKERIRR